MAGLFSHLTIKNITFKNRIVVSPMCQYSANDGFANDWHLVHLGARAVGGAALIIMEATSVSPEGRISPEDIGLWKDEHIEFLQRITSFIHANGSVAGVQLAHAGRKGSKKSPWQNNELLSPADGGWQTVAPSPLAFDTNYDKPLELDLQSIKRVIEDFRAAANRSVDAGFKMVEIHAAHGYLIHQFLSPLSNKRIDDYGGSFENRCRLLMEVLRAVQEVLPAENPLFVRISATDWVPGGWTIDDSVELAKVLSQNGVDLIDCSSASNVPHVKIPVEPGYQVPFADAVKAGSGILTGAVGLITSAKQANEIIETGKADMVFLAREMLRDPNFPLHAAHELGVDLAWPVQYERAKPKPKV